MTSMNHRRACVAQVIFYNNSSVFWMYNYQTYLREKNVKRKCQSLKREHTEEQLNRQKLSPALVQSHKKRIEGFILSMIEKPAKVSVYTNKPYQPRPPVDRSKHLSSPAFFTNHHTQASRIHEQIEKNACYDEIPFSNTFTHKFRDGRNGGMRYQPASSSIRVKELLERQSLNYLPNSSGRKSLRKGWGWETKDGITSPTGYVQANFQHTLLKESFQQMSRSINKSLLPALHQKTYFQSVCTLYTESPQFLSLDKPEVAYDEPFQEEIQPQNKKEQPKHNDHLNGKQNSREALIKCGLLPPSSFGGRKSVASVITEMDKSMKNIENVKHNTMDRPNHCTTKTMRTVMNKTLGNQIKIPKGFNNTNKTEANSHSPQSPNGKNMTMYCIGSKDKAKLGIRS